MPKKRSCDQRLAKISQIPQGARPKADQAMRIAKEIASARRYYTNHPEAFRDAAVRRRLEANRNRLAELLRRLEVQAPDLAAVTQSKINAILNQ